MAIEILHSRTATLIDGSNPDEIQAADWNDAHPITGDGMGLLFSNSAGAVAETMTVDMGTLTASTPLTFKQTWDNAAYDVEFGGLDVVIKGANSTELPTFEGVPDSQFFRVRAQFSDNSYGDALHVTRDSLKVYNKIQVFNEGSPFSGTSDLLFSANDGLAFGEFGTFDANYAAFNNAGAFLSALDVNGDGKYVELTSANLNCFVVTGGNQGAETTLETSPLQTKLVEWANVPTNTDIADGYSQCGIDTNTGDIYLAANVGGTIFKVQLV